MLNHNKSLSVTKDFTPKQRAARGIHNIDFRIKENSVEPANWRSLIDLDRLDFSQLEGGPLTQLFGSYNHGLYKLRVVAQGVENGYSVGRFPGHGEKATKLKDAWTYQLRTESTWVNIGLTDTKIIKGVRFYIHPNKDGKFLVKKILLGESIELGGAYGTIDSAKRYVRKLIQMKGI